MPDKTYLLPVEERRKRRLKILRSLANYERGQKLVIEHCRKNVPFWVNYFCWTFDPRETPKTVPFDLFPLQEEYLLWRDRVRLNKTNGVTEKSRDMGITWLNVAYQLHAWLFEDGFKGGFGSRKEMLVDRIGDMDSIFEKIRFLLRHLPSWMVPNGFNWNKHDNYLKLINPGNGSAITGEAGDNIGRGGRNSLYDVDEAAFLERPLKVDAALSNNTNVVFYTSSANGQNEFYNKRMNYAIEHVFTYHWKSDPRKNNEWYAGMCAKYDPIIVASEIDIDYTASVEGIFIPAIWVQSAINLEIPAKGKRVAGLDVALSGKSVNVFTPRQGAVVFNPESWRGLNTTETAYKAKELAIANKIKHISFDSDGVGAGVEATYGLAKDLPFTYTAVSGGGKPSEREWQGESRTSLEKFANKRAELWGMLRDRFRKTYNYVNDIATYPLDELISIPNHPTLVRQISVPLGKVTSTGKILIESKLDMSKRGVGSPDFADSLAYSEETPVVIDYLLFVS